MRICLFTIGTMGDVIPFARLARTLLSRGHDVTVSSWPHYASWFPPPMAFVAAGGSPSAEAFDDGFAAALREDDVQQQKWQFCRLFYGLGGDPRRSREAYAGARAALAGHDVAVINVLDHVAQVAADALSVPWVSYSSRPPADAAAADALNAELDRALSELLSEATDRRVAVRSFRSEGSRGALAACSALLVPDADPRAILTGAWLDPPVAAPLADELERHLAAGPTLFCTFGTMPDTRGRTAALVQAARRSGWRAIVQVLAPAVPPPVPDASILIWRARLPFDALLPRVAAVVHHGSVGTVHEVARAGRPALVIPHMADQFFWGLTLHDRGLGPPPVRFDELDVAVLAARMGALRSPAYAGRLEAMASELGREDGVAVAARHVERTASA